MRTIKTYHNLLLILILLGLGKSVQADSPLTSTPFWQAYEGDKDIDYAKANGLNKKVLKQLAGTKLSCDKKIAIINSFGWESGYTAVFEDYLIEKRKGLTRDVFKYLKESGDDLPQETVQTRMLTTDDLVCWAYLRAMDNYKTPEFSMKGAFLAYWRDQKNMSAGVVMCLIVSQQAMLYDWCKIYESAQMFIVEPVYERNLLKEDAKTIIMEYMNLYEQDCD